MSQPQLQPNAPHPMYWPQYMRPDFTIDHASVFFNSFFGENKEYKVVAVVNIVPRFSDCLQKSVEGKTEPEVIEGVIKYLQSI